MSPGALVNHVDEEWYYCLDHRTVEPLDGCRATVRIGPFPSREEAARALETVKRRNDDWDNDPDWADDIE
jgi:hypothetical protein